MTAPTSTNRAASAGPLPEPVRSASLTSRTTRQPPTLNQITSTPAMLQRANTYLLVAMALFAALSTLAGVFWSNAAQATADNTAPALIGAQRLYSRVAEANAEAAAAHLSIGAETPQEQALRPGDDRVNRNAYLVAIEQATVEGEKVSSTIGDDDLAHNAMQDINLALVTFTGRIEAARALNVRAIDGADDELRAAIDVVANEIDPAITVLNTEGQEKLERERNSGREVGWAALGLGAATIGALIVLQRALTRRTNRVFNIALVIATVCVGAAVALLLWASASRSASLSSASEGGLEAIVTTSELQRSIYEFHSDLTLQVIDADTRSLDESANLIDTGIAELQVGADSARERAAATALSTRWQRYRETADQISTFAGQNSSAATSAFRDRGVPEFTGVNLAVESALSDNQIQFQNGVNAATDAVRLVPYLAVALLMLAAILTVVGIQQRIGEYR